MLPRVALRQVTREDVCRLLGWLRDEEVSSRWFGKYVSGEPAHHGYDPIYMLETCEDEWNEVLRHHPQLLVFSVYGEADGHIGECQMQVNGRNDAEVFLLIGRKDLWYQGYGASALTAILDQAFSYYRLERAWAKVPETNAPALGLFERLGFTFEGTSIHRTEPDGNSIRAFRMSMSSTAYREHQGRVGKQSRGPVVTVTGLAGGGSEAVAAEVAQLTGARSIDDEIPKRMCQRLGRSMGELEALEASYSSIWGRILRFLTAPWERYGAYNMSPDELVTWTSIEFYSPQDYLTKEQYLKGLKGVISELSLEGNVVLHGHGSHLSAPSRVKAIHVFVRASEASRRQRVAQKLGLSLRNAGRWLTKADREHVVLHKSLFGADLLDMDSYDLVLNMDRLSLEAAAQTAASALEAAGFVPAHAVPVQRREEADNWLMTRADALKDVDIFKGLTHEQIERVAALGDPVRVSAGQALGRAGELGDRLFIITEGKAELSAHSSVGEITVRTAGAGESFPLATLVGSGILITSVEAMTDMDLLAIPSPRLRKLCLDEPEIGMRMYAAIAEALGKRYSRTLKRLTASAERVLKEADFFSNV